MSVLAGPVLVTGATGFIGRHLIERLVADRVEVHGLVRSGVAAVPSGVTCWTGDLRDAGAIAGIVARVRPRTVFHLSGHTAGRGRVDGEAMAAAFDVNVGGTLALWRALVDGASELRQVVAVGGLEEYGNGPVPFVESQREQPTSAYSVSQVAATHVGLLWHRAHGLPLTILRPALVYGPRQAVTFLVPGLIEACLMGRPFALTAGTQTREYVFVDDVVDALRLAATEPRAVGRVLNIGDGVERPVIDVAHLVAARVGRPECIEVGGRPPRAAEVRRMISDTTQARQVLGWTPATRFEDGVDRTIAWHRAAAASAAGCRP